MQTTAETSIPKLVLTGGPCGGKTTGLHYLMEKLRDYGFVAVVVPEIATEFISGGIAPNTNGLTPEQFEEFIFHEMIRREAVYAGMARKINTPKKVLLCDRGLFDILAYANPEQFYFWLDARGLDVLSGRDARYKAVFHLVTAALGAETFYTLENNNARSETPEQARELDARILRAWTGREHVHIIDNSTDFKGKMRRLLKAVCHELGIPVPLEIERKFLIQKPNIRNFGDPPQAITIEQTYLRGDDPLVERRVRKRMQGNSVMFLETEKRFLRTSVRSEKEWPISETRYLSALAYERAPDSITVRKIRMCFTYRNQYFEMDRFISPHPDLWLLEIELTEEQQEIELPTFIRIVKEVTDDSSFSNRELARISP